MFKHIFPSPHGGWHSSLWNAAVSTRRNATTTVRIRTCIMNFDHVTKLNANIISFCFSSIILGHTGTNVLLHLPFYGRHARGMEEVLNKTSGLNR